MNKLLPLAAGVLLCGPAYAQSTVKVTPSIDARLRYENVDQAGLTDEAEALTLRVRPGVTLSSGEWSTLIEGEATIVLATGYNDGTNGKTRYPLVADPRNYELNRAQIRWAPKNASVTLGRQRIELADSRWVGSAPWRQNEQTFDAARGTWNAGNVSVDLTYAWSDRTVNGRRGFGARPTAIHGDNVFALLGYKTKIGTLTGFAYLVDQDSAAVQGYRLSSQTWGARFAGSRDLSKDVKLAYAASYARQSDWHSNPNHYAADYWMGEATLTAHGATAVAGYEVLGAGHGVAGGAPLTSVQTPLASYFKWQGWASKFGTTPPNGLHDLYGTLGYGWKKVAIFDAINLSATYHRFDSDLLSQHYGNEVDLLASVKKGHYTASVRYAKYNADLFATDARKFWLQLDWAL